MLYAVLSVALVAVLALLFYKPWRKAANNAVVQGAHDAKQAVKDEVNKL